MTLRAVAWGLAWFVALYPPLMAAVWIAGGLLFRLFEERVVDEEAPAVWPGVTLLVPAFNEELVVARCVRAALDSDYPELEVIVLDDGSTDGTVEVAREAGGSDPRLRVIRDPINRGKADRLNVGFLRASHELVAVADADTHVHPAALKLLVRRLQRSPRLAAVAGSPLVTNRTNLLAAMQIIETASIIGLIRRAQALAGHVGVVAGVLALFRRTAVLGVGGYDPRMATEDIDLTWRLLLAGWDTTFEPAALVGMQVPTNLRSLWKQRRRWARGQGEVIHLHFGRVARWRQRWVWPVVFEATASLLWAVLFTITLAVSCAALFVPSADAFGGLGIAWGVAIGVVAIVQVVIAVWLGARYDRAGTLAVLVAPLVTLGLWIVNVSAAVAAELPALARGPSENAVVWNIQRERIGATR